MSALEGEKAPDFSLEGSDGKSHTTVVVGPDGHVLKHWASVKKAETHPQEVLAFLLGKKS
jgi:peroxiredoxin